MLIFVNCCSIPRFAVCGVGGIIVICCSTVLACVGQADVRLRFKKSGGFLCPFVPFLPITSILVNTYLLINIGGTTWICVLLWLAAGVLVYALYGRTHSLL
ncbi:hypothetical protein DM860_016484 [Cuscuta australis]|uniref:Cationic amino acid transporter C-terminal domain-containing protein n=1 Tax=Cuscuta australis TaxID=267555 RepID=A0A328E3J3_9ASTE|nr:hypothetical protein DM860_016484 [Cuscuta australis]